MPGSPASLDGPVSPPTREFAATVTDGRGILGYPGPVTLRAMVETQKERDDREFRELVDELRVVLPGVQILGALLFTVAFSNRFESFSAMETRIYFAGFLASGVAAVLLIAPTAAHRILWRQPKRERLLRAASRCALAGTCALAFALILTTYLVCEFIYGNEIAAIVSGLFVGLISWLWYALPFLQRITGPRDDPSSTVSQPPQAPHA